ncbi:hypothetical protein ACUNWD_06995 [Sunxiuqinia sp. A32]|uniref:hypothetical protein n=1 Tax=Sunxiuqinia sp. A32 TaxID=3461496 RepID=UPI0040458932
MMEEKDIIIYPEFCYIHSFKLELVEAKIKFDLFKNKTGQYIVVSSNLEQHDKSVTFYRDYDHLSSVFKEEFTEIEMLYWK